MSAPYPKSVHMRLLHSAGRDESIFHDHTLTRHGDRWRIIEFGELGLPRAIQVEMVHHIGH